MDVCESCGGDIKPGDAAIRVSYGTMDGRGLFRAARQHGSDLFCTRDDCAGPATRTWPPQAKEA